MRCSSCSRPLKPVVVFDIDGTLADYHGAFTKFASLYWGRSFPLGYTGEEEFDEFLGLSKAEYRETKLAYRQGGNKRWLTPYPGMVELVKKIRTRTIEIWVATTRPWNSLSNVDPDTQEWLRRNDLNPDGLLYGDTKYEQLCKAVDVRRIIACVEDLPEQFDVARDLGLPVIQIVREHNSSPRSERTPRGTVDIVWEWIEEKIDRWQYINESVGAF